MSAPVHRTSERPSAAALAAARQRREEGRTGRPSGTGTSAEQALLGLQSSIGNQAAAATVQRARGRTLERAPGTDADRPGSAPGARRAPGGPTRRASDSGTHGMEVDPALREQATAARRAALAAGFPPSGRTRRGSDTDTRPGPAGLPRRGSESGTHGMEADPALREQAAAARRAAEEKAAAEEAAETRRRVRAGAEATAATARNRNTAKKAAGEAAAKGARLLAEAEAAAAEAAEIQRRRRAGAEAAAAKARERIAAAEAAAAEEDRLRREAEAAAEADRSRRREEETRPAVVEEARPAVVEETRPAVVEETHTAVVEETHTAVEEEGEAAVRAPVEEEEEARTAVEDVTLTPEERAARDARLAELAARFAPSGRTRRGSDLDYRPDPADLTRRGSDSGVRYTDVGAAPSEHTDTATDDTRAAADARAEARSDRLKAVAENADQGKKLLEPGDALGKGVQAPTAAGLGQEATEAAAAAPENDTAAANASALKHDASATGVSGASLSAVTELLSFGASVADSFRNLRTALEKGSGAGYHNAHKKGKTKATDAGVSVASTGANAGTIAKEAVKLQGVASTVAATEASGVLSGVAGVAKSVRAAFKSKGAIEKIHGLRRLQKDNAAHSKRLLRLEAEANTAELNARFAREAVERARNDREGRTEEEWAAGVRAAGAAYEQVALIEARAKADFLSNARDLEDLNFATNLAKSRKVSQAVKEMGGGVMGEGLKGGGGIATVAIVATGALASNPAGWITAAVGAGLVLTTAAYKGGSAAYGRFQEAHHPELYTPEGEPIPTAKGSGDSLLHAMKFWKKITRYKRQLAAHKIYNMVAREDTDPALRASALQLLILIKAGPTDHKLDRDEWEASLKQPAKKGDWIKEITDQLASS
ncbi:hypothetical protein STENM36S_01422 [Streptomyces tendae]